MNYYLDDFVTMGGECRPCPFDQYSSSGSYGLGSCKHKKPCTSDDYAFKYSECDSWRDERTKSYFWKYPMICDESRPESVKLPEDKLEHCRGCGKGEFRQINETCSYCDEGFYQDQDNHDGEKGKITSCKVCPKGNYAPKQITYGHFEEMPPVLNQTIICSEVNDIGDPKNCDLMTGWHINNQGQLDSGIGIYQGNKLQIKTMILVVS